MCIHFPNHELHAVVPPQNVIRYFAHVISRWMPVVGLHMVKGQGVRNWNPSKGDNVVSKKPCNA